MKQVNYKKLILPNIPYVFIGLIATKLGQAARLAPGVDFSSKALHIQDGAGAAGRVSGTRYCLALCPSPLEPWGPSQTWLMLVLDSLQLWWPKQYPEPRGVQ